MRAKFERAKKHPGLESLRHSPGVCTCQKLRSASRATTRLYDDHLRPAGITIGQYSVLARLYYAPALPIRKLAEKLEVDRTTLTRVLAILERDGLVSIAVDEDDTRVRSVSITQAGLERLEQAYPLWEAAQEAIAAALGRDQLEGFRAALDSSIASLKG